MTEKQGDENEVSRFEGEDQHGWSPNVGSGGSERATEANKKAFGEPPPDRGPGRVISEEERTGVPATDTHARTPLGVGTSSTTRAEEYGAEGDPDRSTWGTKGESQRPYGGVDDERDAGSDPQ